MIQLCIVMLLLSGVNCFLSPNRYEYHLNLDIRSSNHNGVGDWAPLDCTVDGLGHIIVVGKIILDKYGPPQTNIKSDCIEVTIGGGGPQAAWGACAGLAVGGILKSEGERQEHTASAKRKVNEVPPKQSVSFLAPIGMKNWTPKLKESLDSLLPMLHTSPILIPSNDHITPTINIWHDENEIVHWKPVNGSFSEEGADGLWRNRPCAQDILDVIDGFGGNIALHSILEAGNNPTGKGQDALPFFNVTLMDRVSVAGIEPIVFPDEVTGLVSNKDATGVSSLIKRVEAYLSDSSKENNIRKKLIVVPDKSCHDALFSDRNLDEKQVEFAVRDGANGSFAKKTLVPPAVLCTPDGAPINPTGAGNAYSGAYVSCRASGCSAEKAAIIANAVGAVVCEYNNLPPWTWAVLDRIAEAACEIKANVHRQEQA